MICIVICIGNEADIIASHVEQQDESPLEPEPDYAAIPEQPEEISLVRVVIAEAGMVISVIAIVVVATMVAMGFFTQIKF